MNVDCRIHKAGSQTEWKEEKESRQSRSLLPPPHFPLPLSMSSSLSIHVGYLDMIFYAPQCLSNHIKLKLLRSKSLIPKTISLRYLSQQQIIKASICLN